MLAYELNPRAAFNYCIFGYNHDAVRNMVRTVVAIIQMGTAGNMDFISNAAIFVYNGTLNHTIMPDTHVRLAAGILLSSSADSK